MAFGLTSLNLETPVRWARIFVLASAFVPVLLLGGTGCSNPTGNCTPNGSYCSIDANTCCSRHCGIPNDLLNMVVCHEPD